MAYIYSVHGSDCSWYPDYSSVNQWGGDDVTWKKHEFLLNANYEFVSGGTIFIEYSNSRRSGDVGYQPVVMAGKSNTLTFGAILGL